MASQTAAMKVAVLCVAAWVHSALGSRMLRRGLVLEQSSGGGAGAVVVRHTLGDEKPITQVVRLLEEMLKKSAQEQEKDRVAYAKFKCYCDTQTEEKNKIIEDCTKAIETLEADIQELQGDNGELSTKSAELQKAMADNNQTRLTATTIRGKENEIFIALRDEMIENIRILKLAIEELGTIGADQTLADSVAHEQFMAGFNESDPEAALGLFEKNVRVALVAAEGLLKPGDAKRARLTALLQAPLGTTYEVQSGEIVGILREMKMTFNETLEDAIGTEERQNQTYTEFMKVKQEEYDKLEDDFDDAQAQLGSNDGILSTKKDQLDDEIKAKGDAQDFLTKLEPMCADKAKDYEGRKLFRANEQAAISQCIAFLSSDEAFKTMAKLNSTGTAGGAVGPPVLVQTGMQREGSGDPTIRRSVELLLAQAAKRTRSTKLRRVVASLSTGNPFDIVIGEIEKIKQLIKEEGEMDVEKKEWCDDEVPKTLNEIKKTKKDMQTTRRDITNLNQLIYHKKTGLKVSIEKKEKELEENTNAIKEATAQRRMDNQNYQEAAGNTAEARALLEKAIKMLTVYYETTYKEASQVFLQADPIDPPEDPNPPATWDDGKIGTEDVGNKAIGMLKFLLTETEKEEASYHTTEQKAQSDYEDNMADLKDTEQDLQDTLASLQEQLADAEKRLVDKKVELQQLQADKRSLVEYKFKIKPGCDWLQANFVTRQGFRADETASLNKAIGILKKSPGYLSAKEVELHDSWGECKDICIEFGADHAKCLACNAKVSVPGYCAGHEGVEGCDAGAPAPAGAGP